ncbi:S1 family peptidase [Nocardia aurea]|uniref:Serine protease n=1 Tax=Nocardia aurea TaxID=2144174 RepID=A0ABV3FNK3_9NOCA
MTRAHRAAVLATAALVAVAVPGTAGAIVGGGEVDAAGYPWLAAVGSPLFLTRPSGQFCGGALIAPDRVLTSAHCVQIAQPVPRALSVTFGRTDLRSSDGETVGVTDIRLHPGFRETSFGGTAVYHDDLAILTLAAPRPGPFAEIGAADATTGSILGWGATSETDISGTRLRAASVPMVSDAECAAVYGPAFDPRDMLCAGSTTADTGAYDSGGPLLVDGFLAGITSWGNGVARPGFPGVYSRLPATDF